MKKISLVLGTFLVFGFVFAVYPQMINAGEKVTICHATGSESNPYSKINVDKNSTVGGHGVDDNDIIPPFDDYPSGKNWITGEAIWYNDCKVTGKITVNKIVVGNEDVNDKDFKLYVDDKKVGDEEKTTFNSGTYTVSEQPKDGVPSGYITTFGGACNSSGEITIGVGEDKTCTITNTYPPQTPTGTLTIQKYDCPANFVPNRTNNGVGSQIPENCTPQSGVGFEYTYDPNNSTNNTGPYLGLFGDPTFFTQLALTDGNGLSINPNMLSPGRYIVRETDPTNLLGLYCVGDGDTNPSNNDNQEITFVPKDSTNVNCVAYNKETSEPDPESLVCEPGVNLLENGGFEAPALSNGTWSIIPDSNPLLKWLVAWVVLQESGALGLEIQNNVAGSPASGAQHAELDGNHPVTIWQNIPTIVGQEYALNFKYSPRPGRNLADNSLQVKVDNSVLGADVATDGTANGNTVWESISRAFTANNPITKIEFYDNGTDTSYGGYLDNVSLTCVPKQTPCEEVVSSQTLVSDDTTTDGDGYASELTFIHPAWTASIPGATWIWATDPVEAPTNNGDLTKVFTKTFSIVGTPIGGTLDVASDNSYNVKLNGNSLPVVFDQNNFQLATQDPYNVSAFLINGLNTLEITVTNWESAEQSADPASNPAGLLYKLSLNENACVPPPPPQCGVGEQLIGNQCVPVVPPPEPTYTPLGLCTDSSANNFNGALPCTYGSSRPPTPSGLVLGVSTEGESCGLYLDRFIRSGRANDVEQVMKLQRFLNKWMNTGLPVTGFYGPLTLQAINAFQEKYADEVLTPWSLTGPTGIVYQTTLRWINLLECSALPLEIPPLVEWSKNPNVPR